MTPDAPKFEKAHKSCSMENVGQIKVFDDQLQHLRAQKCHKTSKKGSVGIQFLIQTQDECA